MKMKNTRRSLPVVLLLLFLLQISVPVYASESGLPSVAAQAYIVMDASTGQVLVQHDGQERRYPASITKIMTAALVLELCGPDLSQQLTVSDEAISALEPGSSSISLCAGETLTLNDALHALILKSANDGANALAEYSAGSITAFVELMNQKAAELGMLDTHFSNPSGLHEDTHYTTAKDIAVLTRWALDVPGFDDLLRRPQYTMQPTNKYPLSRIFESDNLLLSGAMFYSGIVGGKSGWTPEAGFTMMEVVQRNGHTFIAVVLDCPRKTDRYLDCAALFDYCFENFYAVEPSDLVSCLPSVSILSDGKKIGTVQLMPNSTFFMPNIYTLGNVQFNYSVPETYSLGDVFTASVTLLSAEDPKKIICTLPLVPDPSAVEALRVNTNAQETMPNMMRMAVMGGGVSLLSFLFALRASRLNTIRRKAAQKHLRHTLLQRMTSPPER